MIEIKISIVVPVYNEEENIEHFCAEVGEVMKNLPYTYEIIFVDDGSVDKSREILSRLENEVDTIRAIFLARNYGHQIALTCGLDNADGDAVITMDGDMQHPPNLIPTLIEKWREGFDVVQTVRVATEGVSTFKRLTSTLYYKVLNFLSDVPIVEGGSDFRLMDRQVVQAFRQYHEHDKFIRGLIASIGFKQTTIKFTAPKRFAGVSKFSLRKMLHLALDGHCCLFDRAAKDVVLFRLTLRTVQHNSFCARFVRNFYRKCRCGLGDDYHCGKFFWRNATCIFGNCRRIYRKNFPRGKKSTDIFYEK